jgi:WD40 repeat protein
MEQFGKPLKGHYSPVNVVVMTPDGKRAISGSTDGIRIVWDLVKMEKLRELPKDANGSVAITPDGNRAITSSNGTLIVWDLEKMVKVGEPLKFVSKYAQTRLSITQNGRRAIVAADNFLIIFDLEIGSKTFHVFGRTRGNPRHYYHRMWVN